MKYTFVPINERYDNDIASNRHYDDVYPFYDMAADEDDLRIFMNTTNWQNTIKAVLNENDELAGWITFYPRSRPLSRLMAPPSEMPWFGISCAS